MRLDDCPGCYCLYSNSWTGESNCTLYGEYLWTHRSLCCCHSSVYLCIASILVIYMYVRTIPVYRQMHIWLLCLVDIVKVPIWFVFHTAALSLLLVVAFPLHPPTQLTTKHLSPTTCTRRYIHHHIYQGGVLFSHRLWKFLSCVVLFIFALLSAVYFTHCLMS